MVRRKQQLSYRNSLDHNLISTPFVASEDAETMEGLFQGAEEEIESVWVAMSAMRYNSVISPLAHTKRWLHDGKGPMASKLVLIDFYFLVAFNDVSRNSGGDAGIKMRPTSEELSSMSPEFDHRWSTYFANAPDKPVMVVVPYAGCVHSDYT